MSNGNGSLSRPDYNRFGSLIADLKKEMLKGNDNHPMNFTNTYDMLMHFELAAPRHHNTGCTVDRGNRKNSEVRGGRDHTFIPRTTLSGTIFSPGLENHRSYNIKC